MAKCKSCGSPLCSGCSAAKMKEDSPLDFLGGNVGFLARNLGRGALAPIGKNPRTAQASNAGNLSGRLDEIDSRLSAIEGLNAESASQPEMTNVPPDAAAAPANEVKPVFSQPAQAAAQGIFGNKFMRQNAVGAPPLFKKKCNKSKK